MNVGSKRLGWLWSALLVGGLALSSVAPAAAAWIPAPDTDEGRDFARLARVAVYQGEFIADGRLAGAELAAAYALRGTVYRDLDRFRRAEDDLIQAVEIDPDNVMARNNLAWMWATALNSVHRNGPKAVELARQAEELTGGENPAVLDTLAAALARAEQYAEAARTQARAIELYGADVPPEAVERLAVYERGEAVVEAPPALR